MKNVKPCIRYIQFHKNGGLYIQFIDKKDYRSMVTYFDGVNLEFLYKEKSKHEIKITGMLDKETKSGIILTDWNIIRI